ncbi:MAG: phytoene desaturase family protein [Chitinophagaceae bacterium]
MKIAVIGAGISGISAAAYASKDGHEVHVFEKNSTAGGRARQFTTANGYTFDMGPSWYWMPDIFDNFFSDFGYKTADFYQLIELNPQFEMIFSDGKLSLPKDYEDMKDIFEKTEKGAGKNLDRFMQAAQYKYETGMQEYVTKPCHSWLEFISFKMLKTALKLDLFTNFHSYVRKFFTHPRLLSLMEFPVIFLGAAPKNIPAMYSLMNYGGYKLGTWYPMGGFGQLVQAMKTVAEREGAQFHFNSPVNNIVVNDGNICSLQVNNTELYFDAVIASSDYHHTETLLAPQYRNYSETYWAKKTFAPSCLIYYLGFKNKIPRLKHHTLFFENDLDLHVKDIYELKKWPEKPSFYVCCPSKTDPNVAPTGHENLFLLMPLSIGIEDNEAIRDHYFLEMLHRIEKHCGIENLESMIDFKQSYCIREFINDYHSYKGNAYGLANTLSQTAVLKPSLRNKKIGNLFYAGQLTVPGPGVPPSIISGQIAASEVNKLKRKAA